MSLFKSRVRPGYQPVGDLTPPPPNDDPVESEEHMDFTQAPSWEEMDVPNPKLFAPHPPKDPGFMTEEEHEIVSLLGRAYSKYAQLGDQNDLDLKEFAAQIHILQTRIMSRAAARAYPDLYRIL